MNVRNYSIEIACGYREITDVTQALIHSLIFFRTHGKFNYKHEGSYSIGTLGYEVATCDNIDFSYVRCSSSILINRINTKIQEFVDRFTDNTHSGTISLEFYTKRPTRWPFNDAKIVWELWNIKIVIIQNNSLAPIQHSPSDPRSYSDSGMRLDDVLSYKLLDIVRLVNSEKCMLPQMPTQPNLENVFDTSHSELQPYLHNISYKINENAQGNHPMSGGSSNKFTEGGVVTDTSSHSSIKKFLLGTLEL